MRWMWSIVECKARRGEHRGRGSDMATGGGQSQQREAEGPLTVTVVADARSVHVMGERLRETWYCGSMGGYVSVSKRPGGWCGYSGT